jgi:hypothetical protein
MPGNMPVCKKPLDSMARLGVFYSFMWTLLAFENPRGRTGNDGPIFNVPLAKKIVKKRKQNYGSAMRINVVVCLLACQFKFTYGCIGAHPSDGARAVSPAHGAE